MTKEPLPEPVIPWYTRVCWRIYTLATWPSGVRKLKRERFRRTGWMTWESGPDDD